MTDLHSELSDLEGLRGFLRLCLNPGPGRDGRTIEGLARRMPSFLADSIADHAPHLSALRKTAQDAHEAYVTALQDWITAETATDGEATG
ncbi:hypothetical protein [Streptomyces sp. NE06-03C]|uniref:hypothetical protein n=1 Tax=Streptomyces sp. NE06-03C TaxID=3028694 RepID=UPI0029AA5340|nr:hypothetical protein [Streptomyces sp. NE06-03C]MDX2922893.1 hypothetical protein [Streptomyces sp. NE06-03C]